MAVASCHQNPFFAEWDTPYGIPPFDKIKTGDYLPAIKEGIAQQDAEIEAITSNTEAPSFENTIAPLELSGELLAKVSGVLFNVVETDRTDALDAVVEEALPLLSDHEADIAFNKALYERVAAVYNGDQSALSREQQMVLKAHFEAFEREGIGLPQDKQDRLREINSSLSSLTQKIGNNILAESNAFKAYVLAVLSVGKDAVIYGESVLGVLNLAPTNPMRICVATPGRLRRKLGGGIKVVVAKVKTAWEYEGIPLQEVSEAIRSARGAVRDDRRIAAAREASRQGYVSRADCARLERTIRNEASA